MATNTTTGKRIPLERIVWREPSRPIDPKHVKELAASIEEVGLLQPIGVVDLGGEKYEGRLGRHRFEAIKSLGEKDIRAEVLDLDEVGREIATVHENVKRKDMSPIQRARMFARYADLRRAKDPTRTQADIAAELQVSPPEFSNTVLLLAQEVHVQKLVEDGQLAPGHIEHAVAPLQAKLAETAKAYGYTEKEGAKWAEELTVRFAHGAAKDRLDIRTAEREAADFLSRARGQLDRQRLEDLVKKAKVKSCPGCREDSYAARPGAFQEIGGRVVLADAYGNHKWFADTGEFYLTPAEKKEAEREAAETAKARRVAAKQHRAKKQKKTVRDYAVFFSRASADAWAAAFLKAEVEAGIRSMTFERTSRTGDGYSYDDSGRAGTFVVEAAKTKLPAVGLRPLQLADGKGGKFLARIQIGSYRSIPSEQDNVVEARDVAVVRKAREDLLAFQTKAVGVKQDAKDLWPVEAGGFKLGEKVRIGKTDWSSYTGKQGAVLAFDTADDGKSLAAVLDFASAHKVHDVSGLEKLTKFACAKCSRPARVVVTDGKPARVCNGPCGLPEAKCSCEPSKKGKSPKGRGK